MFALPMLINIAYVIFPPAGTAKQSKGVTRWFEIVENISRIAYLVSISVLVSEKPVNPKSAWLMLAALFLILYYIVWIRYFKGGRDIALLGKPFLFVPMPLADFPVLYFNVCRDLAWQYSGGCHYGYFRCRSYNGVSSVVSLIILNLIFHMANLLRKAFWLFIY
mgnify:FL=1